MTMLEQRKIALSNWRKALSETKCPIERMECQGVIRNLERMISEEEHELAQVADTSDEYADWDF